MCDILYVQSIYILYIMEFFLCLFLKAVVVEDEMILNSWEKVKY